MCDFTPFPHDRHRQEIYQCFLENPQTQEKVRRMALQIFKKQYPRTQPIINKGDTMEAMEYILNNYNHFENVHNLCIQAANRLFNTIVENRYVEDELFLKDIEIMERVQESTMASYDTTCKKSLCHKYKYETQNIL